MSTDEQEQTQQSAQPPPPPSSNTNQDFVIRDGFPALRKPDGKPWVEGDEPLPTTSFGVFPDALKQTASDAPSSAASGDDVWETVYDDCRTVFSARTRHDDQAYSAGVTYFLPSVMKPRCALESVVQSIFQAHTACLPEKSMAPEQSGAEWWTLVLDDESDKKEESNMRGHATTNEKEKVTSAAAAAAAAAESSSENGSNQGDEEDEEEENSDEVGLHFDADYGLEEQVTNLFLHPRVATVTYLTSCGAPTVVLDRQSPSQGDGMEALNGPIRRGWLCHPNRGRHLAFDGRLLHGAPATFFPARRQQEVKETNDNDESKPPPSKKAKHNGDQGNETSGPAPPRQRITLLVNVWVNHCPLDAEPLDDEICAQLKTPADALEFDKTTLTKKSVALPEKTNIHLVASKEDPAGEEEVVIGNRLVTAYYSPNMEDLHAAAQSASVVCMEFEKNALRLVVGGMAPQDEEDDDE